jgi:putative DNA primase/helicase
MTYHRKTSEAATGKWRGILLRLGVPDSALTGKHGPCPCCNAGKDRFRFDNKEGRGTWICGCGEAGDGMALAMKFTGREFADVASEIDTILGNEVVGAEKPPAEMTEAQRKAALREVAAQTVRAAPGDLVDAYLTARGIGEIVYPPSLRFARALRDGCGGVRPAMVAVVQDPEGANVTLHRTFLRPDGKAKAEMETPRRLMPGKLPDGACVRLSEYTGGPLGIAEGIETAKAASALYEIPVWAALNASMLARWQPPEGCDEVAVFADNDPKFGGQAAAFTLAHRLACKGLTVTVHLPEVPGDDFADVWLRRQPKGA